MAQPNRDPNGAAGSQDIIDDALRLVDSLQRKLIVAGVRRGVSSVTGPPPKKGDVWEEAVKEDKRSDAPALEQLFGIARTAAPQLAGHLFQAGTTVFRAAGETAGVIGGAWERNRRERDAAAAAANTTASDGGTAEGDGAPPKPITRS